MNRKVPLLILLGCGIVVGMGYSLYTSLHLHQQFTTKPSTLQTVAKDSASPNTKTALPKTVSTIPRTAFPTTTQSSLPAMPQGIAQGVENKVRSSFTNFQFSDGLNTATTSLAKYKENDATKNLETLQNDGVLLANLKGAEGVGVDNILKNIKDPEDYLLGVLSLSENNQVKVILNPDSLTPVFLGGVTIINQTSVSTGSLFNEIKVQNPDLKQVTEIKFSVEGNPLDAYLIQLSDGSIKLYEIKVDGNYVPPYITVKQYLQTEAFKETPN